MDEFYGDLTIGTEVFLAIRETEVSLLRAALAWAFGRRRVIEHLGMRHTLARWRGRWYHVGIEDLR